MRVERIEIDKIVATENSRADASQGLTQLMNSIQQHGLEQPIGVNMEGRGKYKIMYGNRRLAACTKLGWKTIPAVLYTDINEKDQLVKNLVENIQRENVSPGEIGRICEILETKMKMTAGEIAARLNMTESTIKSVIKVYKSIPQEYRDKIAFSPRGGNRQNKMKGAISVSAATRVLAVKGTFGLNTRSVKKLLEYTKVASLSNEDIKIMAFLMQGGATLDQAIEKRKEYKVYRVDVVGIKDEITSLAKESKCAPLSFLAQVCYGMQNPITKPSFVKFVDGRTWQAKSGVGVSE